MGDLIAHFVVHIVFELGTYYTAKLILPLLTFGKLRVEPFLAEQDGTAAPQPPSGAHVVMIRKETAQLIGLAIWIVALPTAIILGRNISTP